MTATSELPTVTVVIPCYTEKRWDGIMRSVRSALDQTHPCAVTVVVDHNEALREELTREIGDRVEVLANRFPQGASGARNTGAFTATSDLVAFLEDDAYADPTWLEQLLRAHRAAPRAVGLGGAIRPIWGERAPRWFPAEFSWAVGATVPRPSDTDVRNVWGGNMMVERRAFRAAGGFATDFGKLGSASQPEDTELCIRMNALAGPAARWRFVPDAVVFHEVPAARRTWGFYLRRCWSEGAGKAAMSTLTASTGPVLDEEAAFVRTVLTRGVARNLLTAVRGDGWGLARSAAIVLGTAASGAGFILSRVRPARPVTRLEDHDGAVELAADAGGDSGLAPMVRLDDRRTGTGIPDEDGLHRGIEEGTASA